jgi:hypothetical protein
MSTEESGKMEKESLSSYKALEAYCEQDENKALN